MNSIYWYKSFIYLMSAFIITLASDDNYYKILGVKRTASQKDIKDAYNSKVKTMHPDKNPNDPNASEKFQKLRDAYKVLSNEEDKILYDKYGKNYKDFKPNSMNDDFPSSVFSQFGFDFGGHQSQHETPRGGDIVINLSVSLEEIYSGQFIEMTRYKPVIKPAPGTRQCNCRQEMVTRQLGPGRFQMMQQTVCDECPNVKLVNEERILEVEVEIGAPDGHTTKIIGEGEPHIEGEPGDLIVKFQTERHSRFARIGNDLYTNVTISLQEALTGFQIEIDHLDGHKVSVSRDKVTWTGARIRKKGEGMPNYDDNTLSGNLYITFNVEFPKQDFSEEEKESIKKILNQPSKIRVHNEL